MKNKTKKRISSHFFKVNKKYLVELFISTNNKKAFVIAAIINNINKSNEWIASIDEIAIEASEIASKTKKVTVSRKTAWEILVTLESEDFIIRKYNWLMLNPAVFSYGTYEKQYYKYLCYRSESDDK